MSGSIFDRFSSSEDPTLRRRVKAISLMLPEFIIRNNQFTTSYPSHSVFTDFLVLHNRKFFRISTRHRTEGAIIVGLKEIPIMKEEFTEEPPTSEAPLIVSDVSRAETPFEQGFSLRRHPTEEKRRTSTEVSTGTPI